MLGRMLSPHYPSFREAAAELVLERYIYSRELGHWHRPADGARVRIERRKRPDGSLAYAVVHLDAAGRPLQPLRRPSALARALGEGR